MDEEKYKNIFDDLRHDFKEAKDAKRLIDNEINRWNDLYYGVTRDKWGEPLKNKPNKSSIYMREIAKQIEWQKPNITEPFISARNPIQLSDMTNEIREMMLEKWANKEFIQNFDRASFIEQLTDVLLREGTAWVESSWEYKHMKEKNIIPHATMQELMNKTYDPDDIEQNPDGTYRVEYHQEKMTKNNPDATVMRNEHVFPDPEARKEDELRFVAVVKLLSPSDLKQIDGIDKTKLDSLISAVTSEEREDTTLGMERDTDNQDYGQRITYEPNDVTRKKIRIVEYWGYYDLDEDGIAEPIKAIWAEKYNQNLMLDENPMPDKAIPFDRVVYSARPFSLWGNPPAFFLGDNQKAKNGMVRGIFDNMSLANNGQQFIQRGALDYVNFKKMINGGRHIVVNKQDGIKDGSFNQLPSSLFNTLEMFTKENQDLMGVSPGTPALGSSGIAKDGQQAQLTMSQQRMAALVRNISNLLRKVITKWLTMAEVFLMDEQIIRLFDNPEQLDMTVFDGVADANVVVRVGTEVNRNMKLQQYNMLMQQGKVLEGELPPGAMKDMVAEMYELFDMHQKANEIRAYQSQPSQEEIQAQQLQLRNAELENQKIQMEIAVMQKDVEARYMNAQARMMEANANYGYKGAQTQEKLAKANVHRMDTVTKPVQIENEIKQSNKESKDNNG